MENISKIILFDPYNPGFVLVITPLSQILETTLNFGQLRDFIAKYFLIKMISRIKSE